MSIERSDEAVDRGTTFPEPPPSKSHPVFVLALLTAAALAAACARFTLSPLQEALRRALYLSDNQLALLQGPALALPMIAGAVPLGILMDRGSRARILVLFSALTIIGGGLTAFASDFSMLFLSRSIVGLSIPVVCTTVFALLADIYPADKRGRASMTIVIGQSVGMSAAFWGGGKMLALFGAVQDSWRWALLTLNLLLLPVTIALLFLREPQRISGLRRRPTAGDALRGLWHLRRLVVPILSGLIMADVAIFMVLTWTASALTRSFFLLPEDVGGVVASAVLVSGLLGPLIGGCLADFCERSGGPRWTLFGLGALALVSVPLGCFAIMPSIARAQLSLGTFLTFMSAILVASTALFTVVIPEELRGICLSVSTGCQLLFSVALAPLFVSLLSTYLGGESSIGQALAGVCVATSILGAMMFVLGARRFTKE